MSFLNLQERMTKYNEAEETYNKGLKALGAKAGAKALGLLNALCRLNLQAVRCLKFSLFLWKYGFCNYFELI